MPFTEFDIAAACVPLWDTTIVGGELIGDGVFVEWYMPSVVLDPATTYKVEVDYEATGTTPDFNMWSLPPGYTEGASDPDVQTLADINNAPSGVQTLTVTIGPGILEWDDAMDDVPAETWIYWALDGADKVTGIRMAILTYEPGVGDWIQEPDHEYEQPPIDQTGFDGSGIVQRMNTVEADVLPSPPYPALNWDAMVANVGDIAWPSSSGTWGSSSGVPSFYQPPGPLGGAVSQGLHSGTLRDANALAARYAFPYGFLPGGGLVAQPPTTDPDPDLVLDESTYTDGREWEDPDKPTSIAEMVLRMPWVQHNFDGTVLGEDPLGADQTPVGNAFETKLVAIPNIEWDANEIAEFDGPTHAFGPVFGAIPDGLDGETGEDLFEVYGPTAGTDLICSDDPEDSDYGAFAFCVHVNLFSGTPVIAGEQEGTICMGAGPTSSAGAWTMRMQYTIEQPRYRYHYLFEVLSPFFPTAAPPVLRVYPRTDGLGASSTPRIWPPPRSRQRSNRATGYL